MRLSLAVFLFWAGPASAQVQQSGGDADLSRSVVKIFTVAKRPNYVQPWDTGYQENFTGSGAIIEGGRILTNAHVVSNQVFLQVRKVGEPKKFTARVKFVAHDSELAVLTVDDPDFFKGTTPVAFGDLPYQRDKVAAYGFPAGGDDLSITEGVVSRIEVTTYSHSQRRLLTIQTDAAINPGNSGGPVFKEGRLIGISFQSYSGSRVENTGYIVPMPVITAFFKDVSDGRYDGVPSLGVYSEKMENESLRAYYGLKDGRTGILVSRVVYGSSAWGVLEENDIITETAGIPVANDRTIPFRGSARVDFSHAVSQRQVGDTLDLGLLRAGKPLAVKVTLKPPATLVEGPRYDVQPAYRIFAGLVFMPLTQDFMGVWGANVPPKFRYFQEYGLPSAERKQIVLLTQVQAHEINVGYHDLRPAVVERVNGRRIAAMADLPEALSHPQGDSHVIELSEHPEFGTRIILDAKAAEKATAEVLARYRIPKAASD